MIRLDVKNYKMILTEKPQQCKHYQLEKLINMNILLVKKYYHLSALRKAFKKQTKTIEDQGQK